MLHRLILRTNRQRCAMNKLKSFWIINVMAMLFFATAVSGEPPRLSLNISTEFKFAGYSTGIRLGGNVGPTGMDRICQQDYGGTARMCTTREWWKTDTSHQHADTFLAWIQPEIVSEYFMPNGDLAMRDWTGTRIIIDVPTQHRTGPTCGNWRQNFTSFIGTVANSDGGDITTASCFDDRNVTCCIPATVDAQ